MWEVASDFLMISGIRGNGDADPDSPASRLAGARRVAFDEEGKNQCGKSLAIF